MRLADEIKEYGAEAVTGLRTLPPRMIADINMARNIRDGYRSRQHAENMAEWAKANPEISNMLNAAHEDYNAWAQDKPWLNLEQS